MERSSFKAYFQDMMCMSCLFSEAKSCLYQKRVAFIGDSRIRQLFYSYIGIISPDMREDGPKVLYMFPPSVSLKSERFL